MVYTMNKRFINRIACWPIIFFSQIAISNEITYGEQLYKQFQCHICHGESGKQPAQDGFPVIAGQNKAYLIRQIIDIRDRVRDNGKTDLMRPLIVKIKESEIELISAFLNKQK